MDFITRPYKKAVKKTVSRRLLSLSKTLQQLGCIILLSCWASLSLADRGSILISNTRINIGAEFLELTSDINFEFPEQTIEALKKGVPLTLVIHTEVINPDAWFWEKPIDSLELRYRLRFHALARMYQVSDMASSEHQNFQSLYSALNFIGSLNQYPITRTEQLATHSGSQFRMQAYLDVEALPLPLRSIAYMTPDWHISSDWVEIPIILEPPEANE